MQKYKPYKKDVSYSYSLGIYPTIELVTSLPEQVEVVFVASGSDHSTGIQKLQSVCAHNGLTTEVNDKMITRLARSENCYAIGLFKKYASPLKDELPHVILVNPDDTGNLGTIMRTMLAFGHTDLGIVRPSVDVFDPRVIRASMGAIFKQRVEYFDSLNDYRTRFSHNLYPFMLEAGSSLHDVNLMAPYALLFGNEGAGLPPAYKEIGSPIRIEQSGEVDSLNLAVATSVALYHAYITK